LRISDKPDCATEQREDSEKGDTCRIIQYNIRQYNNIIHAELIF
jgi:hypothetical protein